MDPSAPAAETAPLENIDEKPTGYGGTKSDMEPLTYDNASLEKRVSIVRRHLLRTGTLLAFLGMAVLIFGIYYSIRYCSAFANYIFVTCAYFSEIYLPALSMIAGLMGIMAGKTGHSCFATFSIIFSVLSVMSSMSQFGGFIYAIVNVWGVTRIGIAAAVMVFFYFAIFVTSIVQTCFSCTGLNPRY